MPDENKTVNIDIQVVGNAEQKFRTIEQQLKAINLERDKLIQSRDSGSTPAVKSQEQLLKLQEKEMLLLKQKSELESLSAVKRDKALQEESKQKQALTKAELKAEQDLVEARLKANQKVAEERKAFEQELTKERTRQQTGNPALERQQLATASGVSRAQTQSDYSKLFGTESYAQQMSNIRKEQELLHQQWIASGRTMDGYKGKMGELTSRYREAQVQLSNYNRTVGISDGVIGGFMRRVQSHVEWIASGAIIAGLIAIPLQLQEAAKSAEAYSAKIKQNLELTEQYAKNHEKLAEDIKYLQESAGLFAVGYGLKIQEVQEAQQILSRRFKDTDTINYLTNLSAIISKLDAVPMKTAASDLEAVVLQFGLNAQQTSDFVNQFTVAVHSARINGTELLDALKRSGSVFNQFGADTKTAIATVSALATTTARTGATIGNSWKSILSNIEKDKVKQAFEELGISIYNIGDNGEKTQKNLDALFGEIMQKWTSFDQETRNKFARDWAGTYQLNALSSFMNDAMPIYKKLMDDMGKANTSLTTKLLSEGMDTYAQKLDKLSAAWDVFAVSLGDKALPELKNFTLGLTEGLQWLTKHREELSRFINFVTLAAEGFMAFRLAMVLSNMEMKSGVTLGTTMNAVMGNTAAKADLAKVGIQGFALSVGQLAWNLMQAAGKMVMFMALAEGINRIASGKSADAAEAEFLSRTAGYGSRDAGAGQEASESDKEILALIGERDKFRQEKALAYGDPGITHGKWSFYMSQSDKDQAQAYDDKIGKLISKSNLSNDLDDFTKKFGDLSKVTLGDHEKTVGDTNIPDLGNKTKDKTKADPMVLTDPSFSENKLELKRYTKNLFNILDKNKAEYQEALEDLGTFTALYGDNNVQAIRQRQQLEQGRILQIQQEQKAIEAQKNQLQSIAGDIIDQYPEMKQVVSRGSSVELPTESGVDIDNVKPAVKSAASALIQEISSQLGVTPVVTSGYREGDPGGHGSGDKLDIAWDNLQWGTDEFNMAVQMAEKAGFSVYAVPHGTGPHLDINGSSLQGLTELSGGISQDQWKAMSKQERLQYKLDNREESQANSMLGQTLSQLDELQKKANDRTKELAKMQAEITKSMFSGVYDESKQSDRRLKAIDSNETLSKLRGNQSSPMRGLTENDRALTSEGQRYTELLAIQERLRKEQEELRVSEVVAAQAMVDSAVTAKQLADATRNLESARRGDTAALQKNTDEQLANDVKIQQSLEKQTELAESASQKVKTFWADSFLDMANSGTEFKDIMKNLWNQIEKDAVYSLLGIKNQSTSVASTMLGKGNSKGTTATPTAALGLFNSNSGAKANAKGIQGPSMANGSFAQNGKKGVLGGKNATGGVVNVPSVAGEDGEEVIVPTEKNTANSKKLLQYASNKLGYTPGADGGTYAPYFKNESLATQPVVNVEQQQNQEHIAELQTANKLMMAQNQMILQMLNNGGNKNTVAQPIVVGGGGQMSDDELYNKLNRMKSNGYNV